MFYTEPFEYILIENCLSDELFSSILNEAKELLANVSEKRENPFLKEDIFPFINKQMLNQFSKVRQFDPKFMFKRAEWSLQPPGYHFKKHVDFDAKILTAVMYVTPEENCGTILYDKENNEIEIPWKPNSIFIHCPFEGTDHSYHNPSKTEHRVTIMCHFMDAKRLDFHKLGDKKYFKSAFSRLK
jgi:hypothetical protein